jgi:hypothetical protein
MYELDVLRQNASAIVNFDLSDTEYWSSAYWSSTEAGADFAIFQWFKNGDGGYTAKGIWLSRARPVRVSNGARCHSELSVRRPGQYASTTRSSQNPQRLLLTLRAPRALR